jgi:hypothetical protein
MLDNHLTNGFAGGDNMEGVDAHAITLEHMAIAAGEDLHVAGDLQGYDARHSQRALEVHLECVNEVVRQASPNLSLEQLRAMDTYVRSQSFTLHLRGTELYWWKGSLTSGHPLTTPANTMINQGMLMYSVWKEKEFSEGFFSDFHRKILMRMLGDDNRASCAPDWKEYLSQEICTRGYADFGHVYTSDAKDGVMYHFRSFEATTLLKRFTRYEPIVGHYIAPLRLDVVLELPLWTRGQGQELVPCEIQAMANADTCLRYLCYHDDATWDKWFPRLVKMFEGTPWQPMYMKRADMLRHVWADQLRLKV